jgi:hypothetical protein
MKCEIVRDDLECSLQHMPPGHEAAWEYRSTLRNKRMVDVPFFKRGAILEEKNCFMLVEMGCAIPADEECQKACGMTPEMIRAAMRAQDKVSLGISPEDYEKFDAGEIAGYNPDGSYKPGPNFKAAAPVAPLAEDDDEEDDK